jgi:tryptophan synthase alpha chain
MSAPTTVRGAAAIRGAFAAARDAGRSALVPYVVCGRPSLDAMPQLLASVAEAGADVIELGVPFSDPLADGTVIRNATRRALDAGVTVASCLDAVRATRAAGLDVPLICMGYVNPLLAYGLERFCRDAAAAGVDGLIIPDVPLELAGDLRNAAAAVGLGITFLATPLTSDERIAELAAASTGFLYAVATTGTTGARAGDVAQSTIDLLGRARAAAGDVPVAVGFGVSTPEHVAALAPHVDGVIVGSALVDLLERDPAAVPAEIARLHLATHRDQ